MQSPDAQIGVIEFLTRNRKRSLGALYRFTVLPAALLAPLVAWLLSWRRPWVPYILSLPLLFFLQFRYLVHDQRDVRYLMGALAIGAIAFAWLVDRLPAPASLILRRLLLLILFLSIVQLAGRGVDPKVMAFLGAVGLTAALLFVIGKIQKISVPRMIAPAAIVLLLTALFLDGPIHDYQFLKQKITLPHLPDSTAAGVLDNMVGPEGTAVAYVAGNQPYPFFGSLLQNELSIVPTKGPPQARFYDWSGDAQMPFGGNDAEVWLGNLKQLDVSHLVVIRAGNVDPERSWMLNRPESFRQIYQDAATEIWQSRPQAH